MNYLVAAPVLLVASALTFGAAVAEEWNGVSSSARYAYLADIASIATTNDETTINLARVPVQGAAGDYSHKIDAYVFRCTAGKARVVQETEFNADGAVSDRFPDPDAAWDDIPANSLVAYVKGIACDGQRSADPTSPSVQAFVDGGRGK
ncbi:MAG: surface-adhesin E family protein [Brevundimonas sp.]